MTDNKRIIFLDWLRVFACFMVILVHCIEPFYLGGAGTHIESARDGLWVTLLGSALRSCVPLFVFISGYLLLPVRMSTLEFIKKRFFRVAVPLIIWVILYAVIPQPGSAFSWNDTVDHLTESTLNFPSPGGHLWFVYMILGVYAMMPIISPWLDRISKSTEEAFLVIWIFTTILPFFRILSSYIGGLPEVWGEANWNRFGTFYYISGFLGYAIAGHYVRRWDEAPSKKAFFYGGIPMIVLGYAISSLWFWYTMPGDFPIDRPIGLAVRMETGWGFCSLGTTLITAGIILLFKNINSTGAFYRHVIAPVAKLSYGMYLMHMFILNFFFPLIRDGLMGLYDLKTYPALVMLLSAVVTFTVSALVCKLISYLPGSKYITG